MEEIVGCADANTKQLGNIRCAISKLFHGETSFKCPYDDLDGVVNDGPLCVVSNQGFRICL